MRELRLSYESRVNVEFRSELEEIFFFNPKQARNRERIIQAVVDFSKPVLVAEADKVFLAFEREHVGQALHIFFDHQTGRELIGALLYVRNDKEEITVVHLAICEEELGDFRVITQVLVDLTRIFRQIRGVRRLRLYYAGRFFRIR